VFYLLSVNSRGMELVQRGDQLWHAGLVPQAQSHICAEKMLAENDAVVLVGGSGALGRQLQEYYLSLGVKHVLIMARRLPEKTVRDDIDVLTQQGVHIYWIEGNAGQIPAWQELLRQVVEHKLKVTALYHLAGVLSDEPVSSLSAENIAKVLTPKLQTCDRLEEVLEELQPQSIVLYSSLSSALGSPAQYSYAAANAYLDAWARTMQLKGLNVRSIQWGPWAGEGMAKSRTHSSVTNNASCIDAISAVEGMDALENILAGSAPVCMAARLPVNESEFIQGKMTFIGLGCRIFDYSRKDKTDIPCPSEGKLSQPELQNKIKNLIREMAGIENHHEDYTEMTFSALGLDSLAMTHLRKRIATETSLVLTIGELYSYPTVSSLIEYLHHKAAPTQNKSGNEIQQQRFSDEEERERKKLAENICNILKCI